MPSDRVHEEAEVLEHYISEELEELIAAKLGEPSHDPHGTPIPGPDLELPPLEDALAVKPPPARGHGRKRPAGRGGGRRGRAPLARRPRQGPGAHLALPRAGLRRRGRLHRPGQLRDQHRRRRQVRLPAALGGPRRQPDRDAGPDAVGEARHRDRQEPRRALPRELLAAHRDRALAAGRAGRDGLRHRRGGRRRPRPQPALRHPALPGRGARRRRRLRDPRPPAEGLPAPRGRDRGAGRGRGRRLRGRALPRPSRRRPGRRPPLQAGLRRHREHPAGDRDHRRDGDAARHLPALGAHPEAGRRPQRRGAPPDPRLRAGRRGDRALARRRRQPGDDDRRRRALPRQRPDRRRLDRRRLRRLPVARLGQRRDDLRGRAARLRLRLLLGRDDGRPGRDAGLHPPPHPDLRAARGHPGAGAARPRDRRQPDRRPGRQPGRPLLRDPLRAGAAADDLLAPRGDGERWSTPAG